MSRRDAAPTHGWVISSKINKWLALAFIISLLVVFVTIWTVAYSIRRDCTDVYKRDLKAGKYWLHIESGSTKLECPQYEH
jgi:hypothetical protein